MSPWMSGVVAPPVCSSTGSPSDGGLGVLTASLWDDAGLHALSWGSP